MLKAYRFPVQLFVFFERLTLFYWTSTVVKPMHVVTFWPSQAAGLLSKTLRLEVGTAASFLVDASVIDTYAYNPQILEFDFFLRKNRYLAFYLYYFYHLRFKITFCFSVDSLLCSSSEAFANSTWLEREMHEMYGLRFKFSKDRRNLLLDYVSLDAPMQKTYPCVGETEVFYNPLEESIIYYPNTSVEL